MKKIITLLFVLLVHQFCFAQITIVPAPVNEWMVNPAQLVRADFVNAGNASQGRVKVEVRNKSGRTLVTVISENIYIPTGFTHYEPAGVSSADYASSDEATYLRNFMILPTGEYNICYTLSLVQTQEPVQTLCNAISVTSLHSMMLISPFDGEELETKNPALVWSLMNSSLVTSDGSHFEMFVSLWDKKMSKERCIMNKPVLHIDNLSAFQVLYSSDLPALEGAKRYVWQVVKILNGQVVDKTEVWSFSLTDKQPVTPYYVELSREQDGSFYTAVDDQVLFRFDQSYKGNGKPDVQLKDEKGRTFKPDVKNTTKKDEEEINVERTGFNQFKLDLKPYRLKKGFYQLAVKDEMGAEYKIRIKVN